MTALRPRRAWLPAVLVPLALVPVAAAPVVPTQDGPSHLYNAWVLSRLSDASLPLAQHFRVIPFVPNWGGIAPLLLLLQVLPPNAAETLFHAALVAVWVGGCTRLARRTGGDPWVAGAAGGVLAHGFPFVMGFTGYQLSAGLGLWSAAWVGTWAAGSASRAREVGRLALASLLFAALFLSHLAGALVAAGLWAAVALAPPRREPPTLSRRAIQCLPTAVVPLLAIAQRTLGPGTPDIAYRADTWGPGMRLLDLASGGYWLAYAAVDRVPGIALVLLVLLAAASRPRGRHLQSPRAAALALAGAAAFLAYLWAPWATGGGAFLPDRLAPLALLLPLPWAVPAQRSRLTTWRLAALAGLALALALRTSEYREWGARQLALAETVKAFPRGSVVAMGERPLPPTLVDPFTHVWARVAIAREAVALDDYEARLVGLFPLAFRPPSLALAEQLQRDPSSPPPGVTVFGWR